MPSWGFWQHHKINSKFTPVSLLAEFPSFLVIHSSHITRSANRKTLAIANTWEVGKCCCDASAKSSTWNMTTSVMFLKGSSDKVTFRLTSPDLQANSCSTEISSCISAKNLCFLSIGTTPHKVPLGCFQKFIFPQSEYKWKNKTQMFLWHKRVMSSCTTVTSGSTSNWK